MTYEEQIDFTQVPQLSDDDKSFLEDIFARFERVKHGYEQFTNTPPMRRIPEAVGVLQTQPRTGWVLRFADLLEEFRDIGKVIYAAEKERVSPALIDSSAPSRESVIEHSAEAQDLFVEVYKSVADVNVLQWGMESMKFHDFHEAIDGDFTPNCDITREEKKRLEGISAELLFASKDHGDLLAKHIYNAVKLFEGEVFDFVSMKHEMLAAIQAQEAEGEISEGQRPTVGFLKEHYEKSPDAFDMTLFQQRVHDIDALHMAVRSTRMVKEGHIDEADRPKMQEFWDYIEKKLQTPEAKIYFSALKEAYQNPDATYLDSVALAGNSMNSMKR